MNKAVLITGAIAIFSVIIVSLFGFGVISLAITPTCNANYAGDKWCNPSATNELWECKWNPNLNKYEWYTTYCYVTGVSPAWCVNPECKDNSECSTRPVADPRPCIIGDTRCNAGTGNIDQCVSVIGYPQWVQWEDCPLGCSGCECNPPEPPPQCPTCPAPTEWSSCINGQQTRTNYKCDSSTGYQCQQYIETNDCSDCGNGVCEAWENSQFCPQDCPIIPLWGWIVIGIVIVIVIGVVYKKKK